MPHGISKLLLADNALNSHDFVATMRKVIELREQVPSAFGFS